MWYVIDQQGIILSTYPKYVVFNNGNLCIQLNNISREKYSDSEDFYFVPSTVSLPVVEMAKELAERNRLQLEIEYSVKYKELLTEVQSNTVALGLVTRILNEVTPSA